MNKYSTGPNLTQLNLIRPHLTHPMMTLPRTAGLVS